MADLTLKFGAGRNTRALPSDIDPDECQDGENFVLRPGSRIFERRPAIDLVGTAPYANGIRGFAQLEKIDGTLSTLIQAGDGVFEWDGTADGFTFVASVSASAKIRGPLEANWLLDETVIITDLAKLENVSTWDGTTYAEMATGLGSGVTFKAKYCLVENERALFANVTSGSATPHLLVASKRGDNNTLSVSNRPSSSLSAEDPFFIPIPNLGAINGMAAGFGVVVLSTRDRIYALTGNDATDFAISQLYSGSGTSGDEALINLGNDVLIPRIGAIDTLFATNQFGDVLTDDLSFAIGGEIANDDDWKAVFDPITQRVYLISGQGPEAHVFFKFIYDQLTGQVARREQATKISPWGKWTTRLTDVFSTQCMWRMKDPVSGILKVYCGGDAGEIYQLDGTGGQDGGTEDVTAFRVSKMYSVPPRRVTGIDGTLLYRYGEAAETARITAEWSGDQVRTDSAAVSIATSGEGVFFAGDYYFGGDFYFGASRQGAVRGRFAIPGASSDVAFDISADAGSIVRIEEAAIDFVPTKPGA